jgi:hypothetical protein
MKKIALLLITVFVAQAQLLLSAEKNEPPYFKHLHRLQSSQLKQNCLDAVENKGPVNVLGACALLDNELQHLVEFHQERRKENSDMLPFEKGGKKEPLLLDPSNQEIKKAVRIILSTGLENAANVQMCNQYNMFKI